MKIDKIVYEYSVLVTHTVTMSVEEGYDMPKTIKELVETIDSIKLSPKLNHDRRSGDDYDESISFIDYEVIEGDTA